MQNTEIAGSGKVRRTRWHHQFEGAYQRENVDARKIAREEYLEVSEIYAIALGTIPWHLSEEHSAPPELGGTTSSFYYKHFAPTGLWN